MPSYTEESISLALADVKNGMSQRAAAARWGIPRTTIQDRMNGRVSVRKANEHNQRLSKEQESHLVGWIVTQGTLGLAPSHQQVKEIAGQIIRAGGDDQPLGRHWIEGFLQRNLEVKTIRGFLYSSKAAQDQRDLPRAPLQYGRDGDPRGLEFEWIGVSGGGIEEINY